MTLRTGPKRGRGKITEDLSATVVEPWVGFDEVVENMADGVTVVDEDCRIRYLNVAAEQIFGRNRAELVSHRCHDAAVGFFSRDEERRGTGPRACCTAFETREIVKAARETVRRPDGSEIVVLVSASPMHDEVGRFQGIVTTYTDITTYAKAERTLRESEEYARSLLRLYKVLGGAATYTEILQAILSESTALGFETVWLFVLRPDSDDLFMLDARGREETAIKRLMGVDERFSTQIGGESFLVLPYRGDAFLEEIVEASHIVVVEDAREDPRTNKEIVSALGNRTIVNVPLMLADRKLGVLGMGTFGDEGARPPSARQLEYLGSLANHVAVAMDRVRFLKERTEAEEALKKKDADIRRAYVEVIGAVTGNRLVLMTPDEIEGALGEPVSPRKRIATYDSLAGTRAELRLAIEERFPAGRDLDAFIVGVCEGLTNAIKHAGGGHYRLHARGDVAQVTISDEGSGIDFATLPRATLETGFSTMGTLGMGFTLMLETSDRVLLSTQRGSTILVLELGR